MLTKSSFFACVLALCPMISHGAEWLKLADKSVGFNREISTFKAQGAEQNVTHIKLKCTQGTVNVHRMVLHLSDGSQKVIDTLGVLTEGLSSRNVAVPSGLRLKSIEMEYDSVGSQKFAINGMNKKGKIEILAKVPEVSE